MDDIEKADAQARLDAVALKNKISGADPDTLALLFTEARSHNGWLDKPVTEELLPGRFAASLDIPDFVESCLKLRVQPSRSYDQHHQSDQGRQTVSLMLRLHDDHRDNLGCGGPEDLAGLSDQIALEADVGYQEPGAAHHEDDQRR